MMTDLKPGPHINLKIALRAAVNASQAVVEDIATHAQKETTRKHAAHVALLTQRRLDGKTPR